MRRRYWLLALLGLGLGLGIPLLLGGRAILPALGQMPWWWLPMLLLVIAVCWILNAGRLRLLACGAGLRLSYRRALGILMATEFAISATPGGSGGPVTYAWLLRREGLPGPLGVALYAVDQLFDMLFFLVALLALLLYWLLVPAEWHPGWQVGGLGGLLLGGLGVVFLFMRYYRRLLLRGGRLLDRLRVSPRTRRRLARWVIEFRRSLRLVQTYPWPRLLAVAGLCGLHWLLRYSVLYLAVLGVGGAIPWSYTFIVQMLSLSAGQATLLPGGSGGVEASGSLLLAPYLEPATAAAAILVWRFATFYWYLIAGAPVFALMAGRPLWGRLHRNAEPS